MFKFSASPAKVIFLIALVFLGMQAFSGEQGLLRWREYKIKADALENNKEILVAKRKSLENKIARLRAGTTDADFVEDLALNRLDMANPKDVVIKTDN
jgi:cell division protein FtsB